MRSVATSALLLIAGLVPSLAHAAASSADVGGTWLTKDGRAHIKIDKCQANPAQMCGTVVWLKSPLDDKGQPRADIKNPDPTKRSRPMMGYPLMQGLKLEDGAYKGEIYNSDEGKKYSVSLTRESPSELAISGCLLSILCGSETWTRVADDAAASPATGPKPAAAPRHGAAQPKTTGTVPAPQ